MKREMDKIVIEHKWEINQLQDICDQFYISSQNPYKESEKKLAEQLCLLLEDMHMNW